MHVINDCTKKLIITNISTIYITTPKFSFMNLFSITKDYILFVETQLTVNI